MLKVHYIVELNITVICYLVNIDRLSTVINLKENPKIDHRISYIMVAFLSHDMT